MHNYNQIEFTFGVGPDNLGVHERRSRQERRDESPTRTKKVAPQSDQILGRDGITRSRPFFPPKLWKRVETKWRVAPQPPALCSPPVSVILSQTDFRALCSRVLEFGIFTFSSISPNWWASGFLQLFDFISVKSAKIKRWILLLRPSIWSVPFC